MMSLLGKGQVTTQANLRQELAGRGSGPRLKKFIDAFYAQYGRAMVTPPSSGAEGVDEGSSLRPGDLRAPELAAAAVPADSSWLRLIDLLSAWEADLLRRERILSRRETAPQRQRDG